MDAAAAPVVCPFRLVLGLPCPGCGLTRAGAALLEGDLLKALRLQPFALLLAVEALAGWLWLAVRVHRGESLRLPLRFEQWGLAHAAGLLALWLGRLASGTLPF